jgi:hypothetical protein
MRFLNKYKLHANFNSSSRKLPIRILKFNRPKWNSIKKKIIFSKPQKFPNVLIKKVSIRSVIRLKRYYKIKLQLRTYVSSLFDNTVTFRCYNDIKLKKDLISFYLVKPLYRIDILLWYLNYFTSSFEAKQNINSKLILVNGKGVKSNYYLKKGDLVSFSSTKNFERINDFYRVYRKYLRNNMYLSFLEVDYYSNNIVIVKDFIELAPEDLQLLIEKNVDIKHLLSK